jgi:predicted phage terminase large subunit-like protein
MSFIITSHTASLAEKFSREIRDRIESPWYQTLFKTKVNASTRAVDKWKIADGKDEHGEHYNGADVMAAGTGKGIPGYGAHVLVIDDPFSGKEQASSKPEREGIKDWYSTSARTRLAPGGGVIVIMQRWNDDDLAGWLQAKMEDGSGEQWEVIRYPAIATEDEPHRKAGEALHPSRYSLSDLLALKGTFNDPDDFEALYQQNPVPETGVFFEKTDIRYYRRADLPSRDDCAVVNAWDLAISERQTADFTAGFEGLLTRNDDMYITKRVKGHLPSDKIAEAMLDMQKDSGTMHVGVEAGQIQMAIGPLLDIMIKQRKQYSFTLTEMPTGRRDKPTRAQTFRGRMRQGKVYLPHPDECPWVLDLVKELLKFPKGKNDDQVDALAHMFLMLAAVVVKPPRQDKPKKSWRDKVEALAVGKDAGTAMSA